jgi:hypothetical protein
MNRYNPVILPSGVPFTCSEWLDLRSSDVLLLYADSRHELDMLIGMRDHFQDYRVLLILGENLDQLIPEGALLLKPRYVATARNLEPELRMVTEKMLAEMRRNNEGRCTMAATAKTERQTKP